MKKIDKVSYAVRDECVTIQHCNIREHRYSYCISLSFPQCHILPRSHWVDRRNTVLCVVLPPWDIRAWSHSRMPHTHTHTHCPYYHKEFRRSETVISINGSGRRARTARLLLRCTCASVIVQPASEPALLKSDPAEPTRAELQRSESTSPPAQSKAGETEWWPLNASFTHSTRCPSLKSSHSACLRLIRVLRSWTQHF